MRKITKEDEIAMGWLLVFLSTNVFLVCLFATVAMIAWKFFGWELGVATFFGLCTGGTGLFLRSVSKEQKAFVKEAQTDERS